MAFILGPSAFNLMNVFYLFSVWLHMLAAVTWIGGMIFLVLVLVPVIRRSEYQDIRASFIHWIGVRFRWIGWICLILLLLSGLSNLIYRGFSWEDFQNDLFWRSSFGHTLGIKLLLVALILLSSALHDFIIGPRAMALWQTNPTSLEAIRLRRQAGWLGRLNLLLALLVIALGIMLVRGWPG